MLNSPVAEQLSTLSASIDVLLESDLTALRDSDVLEAMRRLEQSLRRAEAVSHRLVVESVERSIPAALGYNSPNKLLVDVLRVSAVDASARVAAARNLGVWHTLSGDSIDPSMPETAAAQRDGDIGPGHSRAVVKVMRKIPHAVDNDDASHAESILAQLARTGTPEDVEQADTGYSRTSTQTETSVTTVTASADAASRSRGRIPN
ncbi:DUF222 domain-containing protein [Rhodococcus oxybenzonivorans]|uniref:DUF222 domain-containing protein n=1 Tax=Rhodococcus oxybenzonivorans TaxID=1990687 RepID=UPI00202AD595|nr:DUF222 domain-containing protein [Rhodococcus oxybenzonivorans]